MKSETREVARKIVSLYYPDDDELLDSIEAALNAERERAAKIVNDARSEGHADLRELVSRIRGTQ